MTTIKYEIKFDYDQLISLIKEAKADIKENWIPTMLILCVVAGVNIIAIKFNLIIGLLFTLSMLSAVVTELYWIIKRWIRWIDLEVKETIKY